MSTSLAAEIERRIALEILRGDRAPGTHLPPVRELAVQYGVTPPTAQRAIDRLAASQLVEPRRGSGVTVCDPRRSNDLSLLPLFFEALVATPDEGARILASLLELRRVVLVHLVGTELVRIRAAARRLAPLLSAAQLAETVEEIAAADLAIARALVDAVDHFAVGAVLQACERVFREVPAVMEAVYGDRAKFRGDVTRITAAMAGASPARAAAAVDRVLRQSDRRSVERFRRAGARAGRRSAGR